MQLNDLVGSPRFKREGDLPLEQDIDSPKEELRSSLELEQNKIMSRSVHLPHKPDEHEDAGIVLPPHNNKMYSFNSEEFEQIMVGIIDLVACGDYEELENFLNLILVDVTQIYDERGFTLAHISCQNNDHKSLMVLIAYAYSFWET